MLKSHMSNSFVVKEIPIDSIQEMVSREYGIAVESVSPLNGGMESAAWLIKSSSGDFVLKCLVYMKVQKLL